MTEHELARTLIQSGRLTAQQAQEAGQRRAPGKGIAHVLVEMGLVSADELLQIDPGAFEKVPAIQQPAPEVAMQPAVSYPAAAPASYAPASYAPSNYDASGQEMVTVTQMEIKRLNVMSVAVVSAIVGAALGFIAGCLSGIMMGMFMSMMMGGLGGIPGGRGGIGGMGGTGTGVSMVMVVMATIMYAIMGFIGGAIGALIYNLVARFVGGIKMELQSTPRSW